MTPMPPEGSPLAFLTKKQRDVLDLLVEFKTSKEISRLLNISPHTVDQRVDAAKIKLGASSRSELALIYRELMDQEGDHARNAEDTIYEQLTYDFPLLADTDDPAQSTSRVGPAIAPLSDPEPGNIAVPEILGDEIRVVPELYDGRFGTLVRLATILAITVLVCVAFLGGLAIFVQVSHLAGVEK